MSKLKVLIIGSKENKKYLLRALNLKNCKVIFHDEDKEFGIFQGFLFDIKSINLLGGYRYYDSTDELDYSFGLKMNYNNIEIGIATLLKEEDSLSPSTFYQISYHF